MKEPMPEPDYNERPEPETLEDVISELRFVAATMECSGRARRRLNELVQALIRIS